MANSNLSKEAFIDAPRIPQDIVAFLDRIFPEKCPDPEDKINDIFYRSGQRSVVRYLIRLYEEQNDNVHRA